jgi:hypothetical protein
MNSMETLKVKPAENPTTRGKIAQGLISVLVTHLRQDLKRVDEPRFQALLETSAEVLTGLKTAFAHYDEGREAAWKRD